MAAKLQHVNILDAGLHSDYGICVACMMRGDDCAWQWLLVQCQKHKKHILKKNPNVNVKCNYKKYFPQKSLRQKLPHDGVNLINLSFKVIGNLLSGRSLLQQWKNSQISWKLELCSIMLREAEVKIKWAVEASCWESRGWQHIFFYTYSVGHNEVIGVCRVGNDADNLGRKHWSEMLTYPRKPVAHWHPLVEVSWVVRELLSI